MWIRFAGTVNPFHDHVNRLEVKPRGILLYACKSPAAIKRPVIENQRTSTKYRLDFGDESPRQRRDSATNDVEYFGSVLIDVTQRRQAFLDRVIA